PFRKVGEGLRGVSPGGSLFIRGGFYGEPIVLNKRMVIGAYAGTVTIGPPSLAPFDLVGDAVDDNGLSLNPKWGAQRIDPSALPNPQLCPRRDPGSYPCTNQFTHQDSGWFGCGPHINWFGATYEGKVYWQDHSSDDDYNIKLTREDRAGYTTAHADHILCEFDSDETIDHFSTPWWSRFHRAVDEGDARARQMMDGSFAIVTGLAGLDCEHGCWSELHPVWALAMNVQPSLEDDLWAIFVRNWGNEGFCGTS